MSSIDNLSAGFAAGAERRFDSQTTSHGRWGEKLGRDAGASLEFMDYRAYVPGDDLRHIDWNAYGRTDRLIVKRFENEIQPHVDILLDTSRSMAITPQKQAAAEFLTGYFMGAAENSRFSCQLWRIKDGVFDRSTYRQLVTEQSAPMDFDSTTSLGATILESGPDWNAKTFKIILSDFLWEEDPFVVTRRLGSAGAWVAYVQLLDAQDVHPDFSGDVRLTDSESEEFAVRRADTGLFKMYEQNLHRHQNQWNSACRAVGAVWAEVVANELDNVYAALSGIVS